MGVLLETYMEDTVPPPVSLLAMVPCLLKNYMKLQYSNESLSLWQMYEWSSKFKNWVSKFTDAMQQGQAHGIVLLQATEEDEHTNWENCGSRADEVATKLDISQ